LLSVSYRGERDISTLVVAAASATIFAETWGSETLRQLLWLVTSLSSEPRFKNKNKIRFPVLP